jgi:mannose/fructose/N-acetylgalactosamine-specific phosphotransferase system component IIB
VAKKQVLNFFSSEQLALNDEIKHHPDLQKLLELTAPQSLEDKIGEIAAYCGVILDGYFTQTEVNIICDKLTEILKQKRALIIHLNS